jgi:hypothetical protein
LCDFKDPLIHLLTDIKHRGRKEGHRKNEFSWKESEHDDGGGKSLDIIIAFKKSHVFILYA